MLEINHNIRSVKLGETICYHVGFLANDRAERVYLGEKKDKDGNVIIRNKVPVEEFGELTNDAVALNNVATELFERSNASWRSGGANGAASEVVLYGTGEFILFQKRSPLKPRFMWEYYAKRVKDAPKGIAKKSKI